MAAASMAAAARTPLTPTEKLSSSLDPKLHQGNRSLPFRQLDFDLALDGALAGPGTNTELPLDELELVCLLGRRRRRLLLGPPHPERHPADLLQGERHATPSVSPPVSPATESSPSPLPLRTLCDVSFFDIRIWSAGFGAVFHCFCGVAPAAADVLAYLDGVAASISNLGERRRRIGDGGVEGFESGWEIGRGIAGMAEAQPRARKAIKDEQERRRDWRRRVGCGYAGG
ncbi:unnamed protein product [Urochloa humidicola]